MRLGTSLKEAGAAISAVAVVLAQGCIVGPKYHAPPPPTVSTYTPQPQPNQTVSSPGAAGAAQTFSPSADVPAQWWTLLHSPDLDAMVLGRRKARD